MSTISLNDFDGTLNSILRVLKQPGAVLLLPTETVYGLVCNWNDPEAREKIYRLKSRDSRKPLGIFAADAAMLQSAGAVINAQAQILMEHLMPGPLTLIVPCENNTTIGFRIPDHPLLAAILRQHRLPLAQTSANLSGQPNALSIAEALASLTESPDLVIDGGPIPPDSQASTVVDVTGSHYRILRQGAIPEAAIAQYLKES